MRQRYDGELVNSLLAALFASALVFIQCSVSGSRMAFSLPAYALIAVAGVLALFARASGPRPSLPPAPGLGRSSWCLALSAVFFAYILARAATSPVEYLARSDYYMVIACLIVYGLTTVFVTGRTERLAVIWVLLGMAAVQVVIATRQFAYGDQWMPFGFVRSGIMDARRASGMFNNPISLAGYLEAVAPFALAIAFWGSKRLWVRLLAGYIAVVSYFGIGLTGSRGGWISSLFSLLVFLALSLYLLRKTNRPRFPLALYLSVIGILAGVALAFGLLQRDQMLQTRLDLLTKERQQGELYDIRQHNWAAALAQWRESPWIGTGAGTHLYFGRKYRHPQLQSDPEHAHSDYLELLAEYGLAGAAGLLAFLLAHAAAGWRGTRALTRLRVEEPYRATPELALNIGALCAFSAYLVHSAFDFNLHLPGNALFFAFVFGLLAHPSPPPAYELGGDDAFDDDPSAPKQTSSPAPIWARFAIPALGLWLLWSGGSKIPAEILGEKARVSIRAGQYEDAIALAERALQKDPLNPSLYYQLGRAHRLRAMTSLQSLRASDLAAAERSFRSALALFEQDVETWLPLAQTLDAQGKFRDARAAYDRAIQLDRHLGQTYTLLADHYQRIGDWENEEYWRKVGFFLTYQGRPTY